LSTVKKLGFIRLVYNANLFEAVTASVHLLSTREGDQNCTFQDMKKCSHTLHHGKEVSRKMNLQNGINKPIYLQGHYFTKAVNSISLENLSGL